LWLLNRYFARINDLFRKDVIIKDNIWKKVVAYKKLFEENSRLTQWGVLKNLVLFVKRKQAAKFLEEKHLKRTKLMSQITNYRRCKDLKTYCARYDYFRCYDTVNNSCECSNFHTYKYCKHQLIVRIDKKRIELPEKFKKEKVLVGDKPGRPEHRGIAKDKN